MASRIFWTASDSSGLTRGFGVAEQAIDEVHHPVRVHPLVGSRLDVSVV